MPRVRTAVGVGKGEGRDLVGTPLPLGPGEAEQAAVLAEGQPARRPRTHRGTSPAARPCPWGRADSCACRAVRPRLLPFPPLCPTFMPLLLHWVNSGQRERCVRCGRSGEGRCRCLGARRGDHVRLARDTSAGSPPSRARAGRGTGGTRPWARTGWRARRKPASWGVRFSFFALHRRQAATTFSQMCAPPRERGITWSRFSAAAPQYWHVHPSRAKTARRVSGACGR